jgi:hypothetical protein
MPRFDVTIAGNLAGALSTTRSGGTEALRDPQDREQFFKVHSAKTS